MRIIQLKKFIEESPNDPFLHYGLALEYQKTDVKTAHDLYLNLLQNHPDYLPTYYHAAHLFWEEDALELAADTFQKGIALAQQVDDRNTLRELQNAWQNFQFETE